MTDLCFTKWDVCYRPSDLAPRHFFLTGGGKEGLDMVHSRHGLFFTTSQEHGVASGGLSIKVQAIVGVTARYPDTP